MGELERRGDKSKCPACGWSLDEGAYRCPKCRIYFCYKCRARVGRQERQYQCADQSCSCYGKLLCPACTVIVTDSREEDTEGEVPALGCALFALLLSALWPMWSLCTRFADTWSLSVNWVAVWVGAGMFIGLFLFGWWSEAGFGASFFLPRKGRRTVALGTHRSCPQCRHPVKHL